MFVALIVAQIIGVWLITDFVSGVFHWWQDAYGDPFWPVIGTHITRPNILHHYAPRALLAKSWFNSSRALLVIALLIAGVAWLAGGLNWMLVLGLSLGVNMNQIHKWSHQSPRRTPRVVRWLQRAGVLQSPAQHRAHHLDTRETNYCILSNFVNPVLERLRFWSALEWMLARGFGIARRGDVQRALMVLEREPEFFEAHAPTVARRVLAELRTAGEPVPAFLLRLDTVRAAA
ncbi:MAG: fatty acid desaturase family protein [Gemmatimonadaceae bacterium]|nr:fatty acid desaturase family protein [Gemmatimonadaceae bacterium]